MGLFDIAKVLLPKVGPILTTLFSGVSIGNNAAMLNNASFVPYKFGDNFTGGFTLEKGHVTINNASLNDKDFVSMSVPRIGSQSGETFVVPRKVGVDVHDVFANMAANDCSSLMVSGSSQSQASAINAGPGVFHYAVAGCGIPVDGVTSVQVGTYLKVICGTDKAIISSQKKIVEITSARFHGRNDLGISVNNIPVTSSGNLGASEVTLSFPSTLPKGIMIDLEIEVDMEDPQALFAEQCKTVKHIELSDAQATAFSAAVLRAFK